MKIEFADSCPFEEDPNNAGSTYTILVKAQEGTPGGVVPSLASNRWAAQPESNVTMELPAIRSHYEIAVIRPLESLLLSPCFHRMALRLRAR